MDYYYQVSHNMFYAKTRLATLFLVVVIEGYESWDSTTLNYTVAATSSDSWTELAEPLILLVMYSCTV